MVSPCVSFCHRFSSSQFYICTYSISYTCILYIYMHTCTCICTFGTWDPARCYYIGSVFPNAYRRHVAACKCSSVQRKPKTIVLSSHEATLGDRLFENAIVYANRSLYGMFIRQMVNGTLPKSAFNYYLHLGVKTWWPPKRAATAQSENWGT